MEVFEWDYLRHAHKNKQPTRDKLIERAFQQYAVGYDFFEDKSSVEMESLFGIFRDGWLLAESFISESKI